MKFLFFLCSILLLFFSGCNHENTRLVTQKSAPYSLRPKLVVGIVVDQMRYDYLPRFWDTYGNGGFKRIITEGFNCKNNHFNYIPTYTGPGHASIYTGTTPAIHGIIANSWYNKETEKKVYCVSDESVTPVGIDHKSGKMSPHRMKTTTVTDQLRLATQMRGKVIGISLKDRGAILPAGHAANAAYWFHGYDQGIWISSSYYMDKLPQWVTEFNTAAVAEKYKTSWHTMYEIKTYTQSGSDTTVFEGILKGEEAPVFPHKLDVLWNKNEGYNSIKTSPFGNSITTDFAIAAIDGEHLGADIDTDFLALSYSSTDYVGHTYGVNSIELQDTYLRLDKDLERLFKALDEKIGTGNYTVFLTSDHGAVHVPAYLQSVKIPAAYFETTALLTKLNAFLHVKFKTDNLIKNSSNNQLFLDHNLLKEKRLKLYEVENAIADEIRYYPGVSEVYTGTDMRTKAYMEGMAHLLQKGYHHKRSGDILIVTEPSVISYSKTGSTHGSGYGYDTHVPLLFFGKGIRKGATAWRTEITDIAPTISSLLGIAFPNGVSGHPIIEVLE